MATQALCPSSGDVCIYGEELVRNYPSEVDPRVVATLDAIDGERYLGDPELFQRLLGTRDAAAEREGCRGMVDGKCPMKPTVTRMPSPSLFRVVRSLVNRE